MEANSSGEDSCVKVAVHIRPLLGDERLQGCKDCVTLAPGKPQVLLTFVMRHGFYCVVVPLLQFQEECGVGGGIVAFWLLELIDS